MKNIIDSLESLIEEPSKGLPEEIFLFATRITPMINVDLLIKNEDGHTLLTWRDDGYHKAGWHVPGGIIRFKEKIAKRIRAVALNELGVKVKFKSSPIAVNEVIIPSHKNRGHFISLLHQCTLTGSLKENIRYKRGVPNPGEWAWHRKCPKNIIPVHKMYSKYINA
jgi:colanic acid biosynthesis protein WcaH